MKTVINSLVRKGQFYKFVGNKFNKKFSSHLIYAINEYGSCDVLDYFKTLLLRNAMHGYFHYMDKNDVGVFYVDGSIKHNEPVAKEYEEMLLPIIDENFGQPFIVKTYYENFEKISKEKYIEKLVEFVSNLDAEINFIKNFPNNNNLTLLEKELKNNFELLI